MRIAYLLSFLLLINVCFSFYLPGVAPKEYHVGDPVSLKVNKLTSIDTQIPYAYYDLPFCRPKHIRDAIENLGEILMGDKIENSEYLVLYFIFFPPIFIFLPYNSHFFDSWKPKLIENAECFVKEVIMQKKWNYLEKESSKIIEFIGNY